MRLLFYFLNFVGVFSFFQIKTISHTKYMYLFSKNEDTNYMPDVSSEKTTFNSILLKSNISINTDIDTIWTKMTDYNHLSEFIPNLDKSIILSDFYVGNQRYKKVFQEGSKKTTGFNFTASVIINTVEEICEKDKKIKFTLDKSDVFSTFYGSWVMTYDDINGPVNLTYILHISPKIFIPLPIIENQIIKGIRKNLSEIKRVLEE